MREPMVIHPELPPNSVRPPPLNDRSLVTVYLLQEESFDYAYDCGFRLAADVAPTVIDHRNRKRNRHSICYLAIGTFGMLGTSDSRKAEI